MWLKRFGSGYSERLWTVKLFAAAVVVTLIFAFNGEWRNAIYAAPLILASGGAWFGIDVAKRIMTSYIGLLMVHSCMKISEEPLIYSIKTFGYASAYLLFMQSLNTAKCPGEK